MTLSPKHKRFCLEYLKDLNATAAYIRAGYKEGAAARTNAARLMANDNIQAEIARLQQERSHRTQVTVDRVLQELSYLAYSKITDVCSFDAKSFKVKDSSLLADWEVATIQEVGRIVTPKGSRNYVKQHSRDQALKLLAQHLGMTNDFEHALAIFRRYGLVLHKNESGDWEVTDISAEQGSDFGTQA